MMADTIGSLAVAITANSGRFIAGMKQSGQATRQFATEANANVMRVNNSMAQLGNVARRLVPVLAGVFGVAAFKGTAQRLDEIGKTASKINTTAESLSRLQFAGEQTGVAVETMNMALQRMNRRIAEAAKGSGEAIKAITEDLKLDPVALAAMDTADQFKAVAEAFKINVAAADRTRVAMKLFDSEGVALVNTMALGADGLQEMAKRSDELGRTISTASAKSAAEFNDTINELKSSLAGVTTELVSSTMPAIKDMASSLTNMIISLRNVDAQMVKNVVQIGAMAIAFTKISAIAGRMIPLGAKIVATIKNITKATAVMQVLLNPASIAKIAVGLAAAVAAGALVEAAFDGIASSAKDAASGIEAVNTSVETMEDLVKRLNAEILQGDLQTIIDQFSGTVADGLAELDPLAGTFVSNIEEINAAIAGLEARAASIFESTRTPAERFAMQLQEIKDLAGQGFLDPETTRRAIEHLTREMDNANALSISSQMQPTAAREVSFAALGAADAAGARRDNVEKNTAEEVKESKKQNATLSEILKFQRNSQGAEITVVNF